MVSAGSRGGRLLSNNLLSLLIIRPYGPRIRDRVFAAFRTAGIDPDRAEVMANDVPDAAIVERIRRQPPDVVLCPFHSVKTSDNEVSNGLTVLTKAEKNCKVFCRVPIIMPVSQYSGAVYEATIRLSKHSISLSSSLLERILRIDEADLDKTVELAEQIAMHLGRYSVSRSRDS